MSKNNYFSSIGLISVLLATGCVASSDSSNLLSELDREPALADLDALLADEPDLALIPRTELKADAFLTSQNFALRDLMTPVKSQGKRGVCSIFSTIGLMEHLYLKAGAEDPDFSEQFLQWSAKFEVGSFPSTSGSNAFFNLQAIQSFGIPAEDVWPYEVDEWNEENDIACTGEDDQPTHCYTNGHPTFEVQTSQKFTLPSNRSLHPLDIKNHIINEQTAVVVGFTFFYQAWNHRLSDLTTSDENWAQGIVLYPNEKDKEASLEKRAGHSILIIGWDDDMVAPMLDENGEAVLDQFGEPVMEQGFYLFKNSWGTDSFGIDNEHGAGYGYISQRYMHEFGRPRVSQTPFFF